jgi:hypothetical protein
MDEGVPEERRSTFDTEGNRVMYDIQDQGTKQRVAVHEELRRHKRRNNSQPEKAYTTTTNLEFRARNITEKGCSKCITKCNTNFSVHDGAFTKA